MLLPAPKALDNAELPELWGHTGIRRDPLWSCFEVSLVCFTQQGKHIFKIPPGFCFLLGLSSPSFRLWCQHVLDSHIPGNLGMAELGGDVEGAERAQSSSEAGAGRDLLVGHPWSSAGSASSPLEPMCFPPIPEQWGHQDTAEAGPKVWGLCVTLL